MHIRNVIKSKNKRLIVIGSLMILVILLGGAYKLLYQRQGIHDKKLVTAVHIVSVSKKDLVKNISLVGHTVPKEQIDIAAKYPGKIEYVGAALGQVVKAGQVLIKEDVGDAALTVDADRHAYNQAAADAQTAEVQLNANYSRARADYDKAQMTYQRNEKVYEVGGISADDMDASRQQMEDAKANLAAIEDQMSNGQASSIVSAKENMAKARSTLLIAQKQENDMYLTSSADGIIGYRQVEAGDVVTAGQKLLSVYNNRTMYVDYQVSEQDLPAFSMGMPVDVNIESLSQSVKGSIIYISPSIDSTSMTYVLRVSLDNPDNLLKGGMFARALVKSVLGSNVIAVPKAAIIAKNGKNYVYIIGSNNVVQQKEVAVGISGDEDTQIISGLTVGERVAIDNLARLRTGLKVNPLIDGSDAT
ncbi:efflux RND transporter periplasmic adaptor subunit [Pectinatus sottacetonis]|uniref:efflux RND transporter periplasmic adaptor subunit n=1 Tax=Pectinatus sottacetonis TaxID=1002795 RepID=UPI0018C64FCD|nr:efflux RND transporter periplasmic adaptor subunit [Pectinatus sottacetonis]